MSDADEVMSFLLNLNPRPQALRGTGYFHDISELADTPYSRVCMSILLLEKGSSGTARTKLDLQDLPLDFTVDPGMVQ